MTMTEPRTGDETREATKDRQPREPGREDLGGLTLETDRGVTTIADDVVAKVAGHACREVDGVDSLGTQFRRLMGRVRPGKENLTQGVNVEVGKREAAVDVVIVVHYGYAIPDLAQTVRDSVIDGVEHVTGLDVVEVNIEIDDIVFEHKEESRVA